MRYVKLGLFLFFIVFLIYVILTGVVSVILYRNQPTIKQAIQSSLGAEEVNISGFFNIPFRYVRARNIELKLDEETTAVIDDITIYYSFWNYVTKGVEYTFTEINVGEVELKSSLPAITKFINELEKPSQENREEISGFTTILNIASFKAKMNLLSQIDSEFSASNIYISLADNRMKLKSTADLIVRLTNAIEYMNSDLEITIDSKDFSKGIGEAAVKFNKIDFGGIPLFENELIYIKLSNQDIVSIDSDTLDSYVVESNNMVLLRLERLFTMDYEPYEEYELMEHILPVGNYKFTANAAIDQGKFAFNLVIGNSETGAKPLVLKGWNGSYPFQVEGKLETEKFGMIDIDLDFIEGEAFPKGTAELRLISFVNGLKFGGKAKVSPKNGELFVESENFRINGGLIGEVDLRLGFTNDVLFMDVPDFGTHNAGVSGTVFKKDFDIVIEGTEIPGEGVVSNIKFDAIGIGEAEYTAYVHIYNDEMTNFLLDGEFIGYRNGKKVNDGVLSVFQEDLSFSRLYFDEYDLLAAADFDFYNPTPTQSVIRVKGTADYQGVYQSPFEVRVTSHQDQTRTLVQVNFTNDLDVMMLVDDEKTELSVNLDEFDLNTFGYPGILSVQGDVNIPEENKFEINSEAQYMIDDYRFQIDLDSVLESGILTINELDVNLNEQELTIEGSVWQTKNYWNGKLYFEDTGDLKFIASSEEINAQLNLDNLRIINPKSYLPGDISIDFLPDDSDLFVSTELSVNGSINDPDFSGDLTIITKMESEKVIVSAVDFTRTSNIIDVERLSFEYNDIVLETDLWAKFTESGFVMTSSGDFELSDTISSKIDLLLQQKDNTTSFAYKLNSLKIADQFAGDFQGGMVYNGKEYILYRNTDKYGISGVYSLTNGTQDWDIEIFSEKIQGSFSGSLVKNLLNSTLSLKGDMEMFAFAQDLFEQLDGEIRINLNIDGNIENPEIDGDIRFYNTSIAFDGIDSRINNAQFIIPIYDGKLLFNDVPLPTTTGNFYITGYIDISEMGLSYLDMNLTPSNKDAYITINIPDPKFNIEGQGYISTARIFGSPPNLNLSADVTLRKTSISIGLISSLQSSGNTKQSTALDSLYFDVSVSTGTGVKFYNEIINVILEQDQTLELAGSFGNDTFAISGDISINRGTITYLGRDFKIDEGSVTFSGDEGDLIPYANINTSARDKDNVGETIEIYLTFEGKLTTISIEDFYTVPDVSNAELYALLGIDSFSSTSTNGNSSSGRELFASGLNTAVNYALNPLSQLIRRKLGLDMFVIRTGAAGTLIQTAGITNVSIDSLISGSSISVGKYLFSNIFLEYELSWERSEYSSFDPQLYWLHTVGVGWDLHKGLFFGYKFSPYLENSADPIYEHRFEFNLHSSF